MYVSITFSEDPSRTDTLQIIKKLGEGKFNVYHTYSASEKKTYALKMFSDTALGTRQYKKESIISNFSHPNIIKYIPVNVNIDNFHCIVTEFAEYGNFLDLVNHGVFNSEVLIRTYFHQLVAGVGHIHSHGIAHLDLKLENLMLGSGFTLKIIDFDLAQKIKEKKITSGGTDGDRAPEIINGSCTDLKAADIYSLGLILYAMRAESASFAEVMSQDANDNRRTSLAYYSTFTKTNTVFWKGKTESMNDPTFFSKDFRALINGMLLCDVSKRFTLEDVKNSNWFKGPILSKEKLRAEMKTRWKLLQKK